MGGAQKRKGRGDEEMGEKTAEKLRRARIEKYVTSFEILGAGAFMAPSRE